MNILQKLVEFGLSEKEANIYLTLLQIGEGSIVDIAAHSLIKRPTIYSGIESLQKKELVYTITHGKRVRYKPKPPSEFKQILRQRETQLQTLVPQLEGIAEIPPLRSEHGIRYVEGKSAVVSLYRELFSRHAQKEEVYIFSSLRDLHAHFPEMLHLFDRLDIRWKWHIREIIPNQAEALEYLRQSQKLRANHTRRQLRVLPKGLEPVDSECMLFSDTLILVSLEPPIYALILTSPAFTKSFRVLFDAAWRLAVPVRGS